MNSRSIEIGKNMTDNGVSAKTFMTSATLNFAAILTLSVGSIFHTVSMNNLYEKIETKEQECAKLIPVRWMTESEMKRPKHKHTIMYRCFHVQLEIDINGVPLPDQPILDKQNWTEDGKPRVTTSSTINILQYKGTNYERD